MVSLFLAGITLPQSAFAQAQATQEKAELTGTRKQLATIVFAGLAGAILGLSTLSFYGRPQEHLSNIAVGFALGVIGGAIMTTYKVATKPYEVYDVSNFERETQLKFTDESYRREIAQTSTEYRPAVGWRWEF
jgi:hypothetical protein